MVRGDLRTLPDTRRENGSGSSYLHSRHRFAPGNSRPRIRRRGLLHHRDPQQSPTCRPRPSRRSSPRRPRCRPTRPNQDQRHVLTHLRLGASFHPKRRRPSSPFHPWRWYSVPVPRRPCPDCRRSGQSSRGPGCRPLPAARRRSRMASARADRKHCGRCTPPLRLHMSGQRPPWRRGLSVYFPQRGHVPPVIWGS